ncbi:hypothetical protein LTR85_000471 [Meristemomyces frigidus]|nr:hypothetical protein LTR85_000471 [Meristemomyces frigidus]
MRLLSSADYTTFKEIINPEDERYAILSHCWGSNAEEITHQQLTTGTYSVGTTGWQKIVRCCDLATSRGFDWVWIDTCCIDKTSSAELSESINSMFNWYQQATECYNFLDDLDVGGISLSLQVDGDGRWKDALDVQDLDRLSSFLDSRWFTRGWTLQELLAPKVVYFFDCRDVFLGSKVDLAGLIALATGIGHDILTGKTALETASVAQRMSWASMRITSRKEDAAYSLLGIFHVNMPLIYGEGTKAFFRLQVEILRASDDQSLLAWGLDEPESDIPTRTGLLAPSPLDFSACRRVRVVVHRSVVIRHGGDFSTPKTSNVLWGSVVSLIRTAIGVLCTVAAIVWAGSPPSPMWVWSMLTIQALFWDPWTTAIFAGVSAALVTYVGLQQIAALFPIPGMFFALLLIPLSWLSLARTIPT